MSHARFVFLTIGGSGVAWMLMSPNNRPLGRSGTLHGSYAACLAAVATLRADYRRIAQPVSVVDPAGQWMWRLYLHGVIVAVSARSYLRVRECGYNLDRFLEATPVAVVVDGARSVRGGRWQAEEPAVPR